MDYLALFCMSAQFRWENDRQENFFPYNQDVWPGNHVVKAAVASPSVTPTHPRVQLLFSVPVSLTFWAWEVIVLRK